MQAGIWSQNENTFTVVQAIIRCMQVDKKCKINNKHVYVHLYLAVQSIWVYVALGNKG